MGIDFGVSMVADFNNAIRFYVRRPTCRPPSYQNIKKTTDILLCVSIVGLFGPLISITPLDFMSTNLPTGHPPSLQHLKEMTDVSFIVSSLELLGPLISIIPLDFLSADLPAD